MLVHVNNNIWVFNDVKKAEELETNNEEVEEGNNGKIEVKEEKSVNYQLAEDEKEKFDGEEKGAINKEAKGEKEELEGEKEEKHKKAKEELKEEKNNELKMEEKDEDTKDSQKENGEKMKDDELKDVLKTKVTKKDNKSILKGFQWRGDFEKEEK
nr:unnamed protein product [Meloidogyne enterolobii]